ncbi:uncharacterized protein TNCV_786411 [Trichonephila clavipes]|nr:uncharacterized protein TNCV_786411 [Trichonephila clavipes]
MGNAKRVSAKRENANLEVMDLTIKHSKIAKAQHLPTPVLQKIKIPPAFDEELAEYQHKLVNYQCKAASELLVLHPTKNKIVECGISVDGTWQRRGYSSMNGCVAALSVDTGKVVDIEIVSSYCPTCRKIAKMPRSIESETFAAGHVCHSNFSRFCVKNGSCWCYENLPTFYCQTRP